MGDSAVTPPIPDGFQMMPALPDGFVPLSAAAFQDAPNLLERFGHGVNAVVTAAKQRYLMATDPAAAAQYTQGMNADEALYQQGRQKGQQSESPAMALVRQNYPNLGDVANDLGSAAALAPTMLIPGGPIVGSMAQGAVGGFLQPSQSGTWGDVAKNTAMGTAVGGVMGGASKGLAPKADVPLPADMQARIDAMKAVGIDNPPLPAITRAPQDWYNFAELGKQEGKPKDLYVAAGQGINDALSNVLPSMQGTATTPYAAAEAARQGVQDFAQASQKDVAAMYDAARNAAGASTEVPMQPIADTLGKVIEDYGVENVPGAVVSRAQQYGLLNGQQTRAFTVNDAEQFRRFLGNNISPANRPQMAALKQLQASVDEAVSNLPAADAQAGQAFQQARSAARDRFAALEPQPIARLNNADEANPNFLPNLFQSGKPGEIGALNTMLQGSSPDAAQAVRSSLLDYLNNAATQSANGRFSGAMLGKAMDRVGPERLSAVLSPADLAQLNNLRTASNALTVAPDMAAVNTSNTGSTLGNMLQKLHVGPMLGAGLGGLVGHATGLPAVPEMIGAALGGVGEGFANNAAARRMQAMLTPNLQAVARTAQPTMPASTFGNLLMNRTALQRLLPLLAN